MGRIGCVRCEKSRHDFVAQIFALIALVHPVLHRVSCSYEAIPNAPEHYETHQNMSLGSNGVDQVLWLRKITTRLRGTNFCINCTSSVCYATSFMQLRNDPKCTELIRNGPNHQFRVQWGGLGVFVVKKSRRDFVPRTFALIAPLHPVLHRVLCSYEKIPNAPEHYEKHQNMSLESNGLDQLCWLRKITTRLRGTNFCINCTSSVRFATSFMQLRNDPKCTEILRNGPKDQFRVQWGGLCLLRKNPDVTSCHELLY